MGIRASRPMGIAAILPSLTHRRTVSGCNPRRLATSPERNNRVFSVLITRIDYQIYVNLSTVVHPGQYLRQRTGARHRVPHACPNVTDSYHDSNGRVQERNQDKPPDRPPYELCYHNGST